MSYLDDPRVFFAAERTMLAWQRTAIALIGLGFVVERFGLFIRMLAGAAAPPPTARLSVSAVLGAGLLIIGAVAAVVSAVQFIRFTKTLSEKEVPRGYAPWFGPAINFAVAACAFAFVAWLVSTA